MDGSRRRVKSPASPKAGWLGSSLNRSGGPIYLIVVYIYLGVRKAKSLASGSFHARRLGSNGLQ